MGVKFTPNFQAPAQWQLSEKKITKLLQEQAWGPVQFAANSRTEDAVVKAGVHKGGRDAKTSDHHPHLTVELPARGRTFHVRLNIHGQVAEISGD
jgi:hypothetical protein